MLVETNTYIYIYINRFYIYKNIFGKILILIKKVGIVSCSLEHAMSYGYEEDYSDMEQLMVLLPS